MEKAAAVSSLGQTSLLIPAWIKGSLHANDRLKLLLTMLQLVSTIDHRSSHPTPDWSDEIRRLGLARLSALRDWNHDAMWEDDTLILPALDEFFNALESELRVMARPVLADSPDSQIAKRTESWCGKLHAWRELEGLSSDVITLLTHGQRQRGDSLHLLVMDLHKQINDVAARLATEDIEGAHVWQIDSEDRSRIRSFMHGLNRTRILKFDHPGLDTAATRDGETLLIQNDIGTNDAHVLVIQVTHRIITVIYSELHKARFNFFKRLLQDIGFGWTTSEAKQSDQLNQGIPYQVGTARYVAESAEAELSALESLGSRIVFVIDWNKARKRLQQVVSKTDAIELLQEAAMRDYGHVAWLTYGGERLVYQAMQTAQPDAFRVGDRLSDVLGEQASRKYLAELMRHCSHMLQSQLPQSLVADEARLLLDATLQERSHEFDLLEDHVAYCHALSDSVCTLFEPGELDPESVTRIAQRAKVWERFADQLVNEARQKADRHRRWAGMADLLVMVDGVADALEETIFTTSMAYAPQMGGVSEETKAQIHPLAKTTLSAVQDLNRAIQIIRRLARTREAVDQEELIRILWQIIRSEPTCDEHLRHIRQYITGSLGSSPALMLLVNELVASLESVSDCLLSASYRLRELTFDPRGFGT